MTGDFVGLFLSFYRILHIVIKRIHERFDDQYSHLVIDLLIGLQILELNDISIPSLFCFVNDRLGTIPPDGKPDGSIGVS